MRETFKLRLFKYAKLKRKNCGRFESKMFFFSKRERNRFVDSLLKLLTELKDVEKRESDSAGQVWGWAFLILAFVR